LLDAAGHKAQLAERGLDHGAWVPLLLMYPAADIPVIQLSLQTRRGPAHQLKIGAALRALRDEGVLIIGSGSATHNLSEFRGADIDAAPPAWVSDFAEWLDASVSGGRTEDLVDYRRRAPGAARNHPSEEHFLPLFTALGAAGEGTAGRRVHTSTTYGILAMDVYQWG
jgi:4,5-DOPA dioxygenase extradiol